MPKLKFCKPIYPEFYHHFGEEVLQIIISFWNVNYTRDVEINYIREVETNSRFIQVYENLLCDLTKYNVFQYSDNTFVTTDKIKLSPVERTPD